MLKKTDRLNNQAILTQRFERRFFSSKWKNVTHRMWILFFCFLPFPLTVWAFRVVINSLFIGCTKACGCKVTFTRFASHIVRLCLPFSFEYLNNMLIFLYVKIMENSSRQIIFQTSYILMPYLKIIIENQIFHLSTLNTSEWQSAKTVFSTFLQNGKTKIVHWCYYSDPYLVEASVTASGLLWCNVTSLANLNLCISCWQTPLTPRCLVWTVLSGSSSFREVNLSNWIRISLKLSVNFDPLVFHPARRAAATSVPPHRDGPVQVRRGWRLCFPPVTILRLLRVVSV